MTVRTEPRVRDEAGATLILALLFMVVIGLIVGGLASWTSNSLTDTLSFAQTRSSQYALSSASQVAIQSIRYTALLGTSPPAAPSPQTLNASPPTYCWGTSADNYGGTELTTQNVAVEVYCSTVWNPTSAATRVVTISACLQSLLPSSPSAAALCAQTPGLQTIVTFDDYSSSAPTVNPGPCVSTCGAGMTINSSVSRSAPPTVTGLSSTQGPVYPANGSTLTVTGTGFVSGSTTVNFVATTASLNLSFAGTSVSVASPTSLTMLIPAATTVTSYYVIVSTPNGSSSAGSAAEYTYQPVVPTVSSISISSGGTPTGSAAGGTSITITGTGFLSNFAGDKTTVDFVDTQNASNVIAALNLTVNSSTSITATTPSVASTDLTYYVVVTTQPTGVSSANGPVFTYQLFNPVVASVSPTNGGGTSQSLALTGIGFITGGTTVTFVPVSGGTTPTATGVSVSSSTALTVTVSGGTKGKVYYVEVTTSGGNSGTGGAANEYTY